METIDRLMAAAETAMRRRGYHAVSMRDLADEIGVKSASAHYYFRHKEDLGAALIARYAARFFAGLDARAAGAATPEARLQAFCAAYRAALVEDELICLCGMLGAESGGLPAPVAEAVADFFRRNLDWLVVAQSAETPRPAREARAARILATLQGGLIVAASLRDPALFDAAVAGLAEPPDG